MTNDAKPQTGRKPDWIAKTKRGSGSFERIGAAWNTDAGGLQVRLAGAQVIDQPFYLFPTDAGGAK